MYLEPFIHLFNKLHFSCLINNFNEYLYFQPMLKQILNGTKKSERHQIYFHGRVSEKDQLKRRAGFGPIGDEVLVRHHNIPTVKHLGNNLVGPS